MLNIRERKRGNKRKKLEGESWERC
jgi:hypothetical protein